MLVMLLNRSLEHLLRALWMIEKYTLCTFSPCLLLVEVCDAGRLLFNLTWLNLACSFSRITKCQNVFLIGSEGFWGHNSCMISRVEVTFTVGSLGWTFVFTVT